MNVVWLNRRVFWRSSLLTLLLVWPLILFGRPAYFYDSVNYYSGGRVAVAFAVGKVASQFGPATFQPATRPAGGEATPGAPPTRAARSILYGVAAYLLSAPAGKMITLVLAQAVVTALTITIVSTALGATGFWAFGIVAVTVAVATPAACFADFAMPDIFAGLAICIFAVLTTHFNHLSGGTRLTLVAVGGFAVASHSSHLPLATGMCLLGAGWIVLALPPTERRSPAIGWLLAPLALGTAATILAGLVGFGELSLAPKRFPLTLARSLEDGPARWYLERNCATRRYTICEVYGNDLPGNVIDLLWGDGNLGSRATPAQMDRIRAEELEIVLRAAEAYPSAQAARTLTNIAEQLLHFGLNSTRFNQRFAFDAAGTPYLELLNVDHGKILDAMETLFILSTLLAIGWAFWRFRALQSDERAMLLLVAAGIVGNAVVCAVFSGVADRYQARVIWVLPMISVAMMLGSRTRWSAGCAISQPDPMARSGAARPTSS
jgi:hypothetical protein